MQRRNAAWLLAAVISVLLVWRWIDGGPNAGSESAVATPSRRDPCYGDSRPTTRLRLHEGATKTPVPGVSLRVFAAGLPSDGLDVGPSSRDGWMELPGRSHVMVESANAGWSLTPPLRLLTEALVTEGLELHRLAAIHLVVRESESGQPAPGWHAAIPVGRNRWSRGLTDGAGRVALPGGTAAITLILLWSERGEVHLLPLIRPSSESLKRGEVGEVYLPAADRLSVVQVTDRDSGMPVPGARLCWLSAEACPGLLADRQGRCATSYRGGAQCVVTADGYAPEEVELQGEPTINVQLGRLRTSRLTLSGPGVEGEGCLELWYWRLPKEPDALPEHTRVPVRARVAHLGALPSVDCDGICLRLSGGRVEEWLAVTLPLREPATMQRPGASATSVRIRLRGGSELGRTLDPGVTCIILQAPVTGELLSAVEACRTLRAVAERGVPAPPRSLLEGMPAGEVNILLPAGGAERAVVALIPGLGFAHRIIGVGETPAELELELQPLPVEMCKAPIRFRLPDGRPPASARIRLRSTPVEDIDSVEFHGFVDSLGFSLVPCRQGNYEVIGGLPTGEGRLEGTVRLDPPFATAPTVELVSRP